MSFHIWTPIYNITHLNIQKQISLLAINHATTLHLISKTIKKRSKTCISFKMIRFELSF